MAPDPNVVQPDPDEDAPPRRDTLRVWRPGGILSVVFCAVLCSGILGACAGGLSERMASRTRILVIGLAILVGVGVGAGVGIHSIRRQVGKGKRIINRPLPHRTGSPPAGLSRSLPGDDRIQAHRLAVQNVLPALPLPPRHVSELFGQHGGITAVAVSSDGRLALSAAGDATVSLWDVETGFELRSFAMLDTRALSLAFSPDGGLLATGWTKGPASNTGIVCVWDAQSGQELRRFEFDDTPGALVFLKDGMHLLIGTSNFLRVWDIEGPTPVALIPMAGNIRSVSLSADGPFALVGLWTQDLRLINLSQAEEVRKFSGHGWSWPLLRPGTVTSVAIGPDEIRALSGSIDQTARVWNLLTGKEMLRYRGHQGWWGWRGVVGVAWLAGGERAVSVSENGQIRVWDATSGEEVARYSHEGGVSCLAATPDGRLTLTGGRDGKVRIWDL